MLLMVKHEQHKPKPQNKFWSVKHSKMPPVVCLCLLKPQSTVSDNETHFVL